MALPRFFVFRCVYLRGALIVAAAVLFAAAASTSALADCLPLAGSPVSCALPGTLGYDANGQNNIVLTVQPNAIVDTAVFPTRLLNLLDSNTITNNGTLFSSTTGDTPIFANNLNTVVNNGTIRLGDFSAGIWVNDDNTVRNYGSITWMHEFSPAREVTATFINIPSPAFTPLTADGCRATRRAWISALR